MFPDDLTTEVLSASLRGHAARNTALANNIANAETPGYKRVDVQFEAALAEAVESDRARLRRGGDVIDAGFGAATRSPRRARRSPRSTGTSPRHARALLAGGGARPPAGPDGSGPVVGGEPATAVAPETGGLTGAFNPLPPGAQVVPA